jgi:hypothetical protein
MNRSLFFLATYKWIIQQHKINFVLNMFRELWVFFFLFVFNDKLIIPTQKAIFTMERAKNW